MMKSQNHFSQFVVLELVVMVRMIEFIQMILVMLGLWWRVIDFFEEIQILIDFIRLFLSHSRALITLFWAFHTKSQPIRCLYLKLRTSTDNFLPTLASFNIDRIAHSPLSLCDIFSELIPTSTARHDQITAMVTLLLIYPNHKSDWWFDDEISVTRRLTTALIDD